MEDGQGCCSGSKPATSGFKICYEKTEEEKNRLSELLFKFMALSLSHTGHVETHSNENGPFFFLQVPVAFF